MRESAANILKWLAPVACIALTVPVGIWAFIGIVIQWNYRPEEILKTAIFGSLVFGILLAVIWLAVLRGRRGKLSGVSRILSLGGGTLLSGWGAYGMVVDTSDFAISIWPFLLGASLVWMGI